MKVVEIDFYNTKRARIVVEMPNTEAMTTRESPHLPHLLLRLFPQLRKHKCGDSIEFEFLGNTEFTEIPHLFEHLIIEIQGQVTASGVLKGETSWDWRIDPRGRFYVVVEYDNAILAHGVIRVAERIINALDAREIEELLVEHELDLLRELARLGDTISGSVDPTKKSFEILHETP